MATKQKQTGARPVSVAPEDYQGMVDTMLELAYRNQQAEDLMMRVANAGGIDEVSAEIKKRRVYAKKMGWTRGNRRASVEDGAPAKPRKLHKPGGNRRRGDRKMKPDSALTQRGVESELHGREGAA